MGMRNAVLLRVRVVVTAVADVKREMSGVALA
jgi:hypothetical protein